MLFKRNKIEQSDVQYALNYASVDKVAEKVQNFLLSMKVEKNTMLRVRLSVEEVLLRWVMHYPGHTEFRLEIGTHWNRPFVVLKLWGEEFDPLRKSDEELDFWSGEILSSVGLSPVFRHVNGCNIVQFPVKRPTGNPGVTLLLSTLAGTMIGIALNFAFPNTLQTIITNTILTPLQDAFIRVLNAVSAPVMFLSVLTTVCGVGSIAVTGKIGKRMVTRFLAYNTVLTAITIILSRYIFNVPHGATSLSQREVSGVLDFFLDVLPGDMLSPLIAGDFTQLIVVALVLGSALLIAGAKAQTLSTIVEECNTVGLVIAEWIGDMSPAFVTLLVILGIQKNTAHMLVGIWRPALLIVLFAVLALSAKMLHVSLYYNVPIKTLVMKMKDSFLLSLRTFSVETSYTANQKCCEKRFGINQQLITYALPIGLICFMPISTVASTVLTLYAAECYQIPVDPIWMIMAVFLSVTLAAAGPPMAGIGILTYTVMFSKLNIPPQALTIVLVGDILMGFVIYPVNQAMLQLELLFEADKLGFLNHKALQEEMKSGS